MSSEITKAYRAGYSDAQGLTTVPARLSESSGHPTSEFDDCGCGCVDQRDCTGECFEKAAVEPTSWEALYWEQVKLKESAVKKMNKVNDLLIRKQTQPALLSQKPVAYRIPEPDYFGKHHYFDATEIRSGKEMLEPLYTKEEL